MAKKKWTNMKIIRVKLNPEQAVLSCCIGVGHIKVLTFTGSGYTCTWPVAANCGVVGGFSNFPFVNSSS